MELVSIGEFARRSGLSPRALRLYDDLGLLPPARVDAGSGYRWYDPAELDTARLIAALRQLGLPLAQIAALLPLDPPGRGAALAGYWAGVEAGHAARRDLADYLVRRLTGKETDMYEVATRQMPQRALLCLKRTVNSEEAWALGKEFIGIIHSRQPVSRLPGRTGATFAIYPADLTADTAGEVEWCLPVPGDQAGELAGRFPELTPRTEPAHEEAYVALGDLQANPPRWELIWQVVRDWGAERHREPSALAARVTHLATRPVTTGTGPDSDFAVPLR
jgi:DNA-binding transcriptional MerR regulator